MFSKDNIKSALLHYIAGVVLYGIAVFFYHTSNYYSGFLNPLTKKIMLFMYISYVVIAPFAFLIKRNKDIREHKPAVFFSVVKKVFVEFFRYVNRFIAEPGHKMPSLSHEEKTVVLFMLVKLFFLPLMLEFLIGNLRTLIVLYPQMSGFQFTLQSVTYLGYSVAFTSIFLMDTLFFSFGYCFEAGFLKNKVRSVEPTVLGWAVAIVCYPPFNGLFGEYVTWGARDYVEYPTLMLTFAARLAIIILLLVYVWATVSLGTKCSNLTNRGIVTKGTYRFIRHPAYISKNMAWWIMALPFMSIPVFVGLAVWSIIYFLRAITEERHLIADPDYQAYCMKTKYRFIPFVY